MAMKKLAALVLILTLSGPAHAFNRDFCVMSTDAAERIMTQRQEGVPQYEMMSRVFDAQFTPGMQRLMTEIVILAYDKPIFGTPRERRLAVQFFADYWWEECMTYSGLPVN
jgi:hypothetical protein